MASIAHKTQLSKTFSAIYENEYVMNKTLREALFLYHAVGKNTNISSNLIITWLDKTISETLPEIETQSAYFPLSSIRPLRSV